MKQKHINQFATEHLAHCDEKSGRQIVRAIVTTLNELGSRFGLPNYEHPIPYADGDRISFERDRYSTELLADAKAAADCLAVIRRPWRKGKDNAAERIAQDILRGVSAGCRATGRDPSTLTSLKEACQPTFALAAVSLTQTRHDARGSVCHAAGAYQTARLFCTLGEYYLPEGDTDLKALRALRLEHAPELRRELSAEKQAIVRACAERARELKRQPLDIYAAPEAPGREMPSQGKLVAALGLRFALGFGLWPFMFVNCMLRTSSQPHDPTAIAEITIDQMLLRIAKTGRGAERTFPIVGSSRTLLELFLTQVRPLHAKAACSRYLAPGRDGEGMSAATLSRAIAELISPVIGCRVTAGHLPHVAAAIVLASPEGSREAARILLGRSYAEADSLLDTIESWARIAKCDALIRRHD